ncbi:hypothetical protein DK853_03410 [Klebsiella oxytoca]|nr:hypothetical protein [Klebsiella oxytoca]RBA01146.1 hypothetical protein DK853_03410 [Klebsiella oxytoca]TXU98754.1 hypothetical protein D4M90_07225 [Klebsiella oxytoca]
MSLTEGSLRLFKFVPDEFVLQLPPQCNSKSIGYRIRNRTQYLITAHVAERHKHHCRQRCRK